MARTPERTQQSLEGFREEIRTFANFPSLFMGLTTADDKLEMTDGVLRIVDANGKVVVDNADPSTYRELIGEAVEPDSYLKSPYFKPAGYPGGMLRVGPLARMNVIDGIDTPRANEEWAESRSLERGAVLSSFHYLYARLIEILFGLERMEQLLHHPDILSKQVRAHARPNNFEGIGVSEAPRGTLIHHYRIDENGLIEWANLIIATGFNNLAMNRGILQAARHYIGSQEIQEGVLNRVEAVVRSFGPCLSCSTHAAGAVPPGAISTPAFA